MKIVQEHGSHPRVHMHDVVRVVPEGLSLRGELEVDLYVVHHPQHVENLGSDWCTRDQRFFKA